MFVFQNGNYIDTLPTTVRLMNLFLCEYILKVSLDKYQITV
jgi:hypothetical protein